MPNNFCKYYEKHGTTLLQYWSDISHFALARSSRPYDLSYITQFACM